MDTALAREVDRIGMWPERVPHTPAPRRRRDRLLTQRQLQTLIDTSLQVGAAESVRTAAAVVYVERGVRPGSRGTSRLPNLTARRHVATGAEGETLVRVEWTDGVGARVLEVLVRCTAAPAADATEADVANPPVIALLRE